MTIKKKESSWLFVLMLFFVFFSCSTKSSDKSIKTGKKIYFDLQSFFDQEIERLAGVQVKKTTSVGAESEERILDETDFERDLKIFSQNDINRPAWSDSYQIDSAFDGRGSLQQLSYTALDPDMKTQSILVDFNGEAVSKIFIENSSSTTVAQTKQILTYEPTKGYSIESHQKVAFTDDNIFLIEVSFLNE